MQNKLSLPNNDVIFDQIRELKNEENEEDRPSVYAYDRIVTLLHAVANEFKIQFPAASVTTASNGIRVSWRQDVREIRLIIGESGANKSYIYWREYDRSDINPADEQSLYFCVNWLLNPTKLQ